MKTLVALMMACVVLAAGAEARQLQAPAVGAPAMVVDAPDGWSFRYTPNNALVTSAEDGSVVLIIGIYENTDTSAEEFAYASASQAGGTMQRVGEISYAGLTWARSRGTVVRSDGLTMNLQTDGVRIDPRHMALITMSSRTAAPQQSLDTATAVMQSARIAR